MMSLVGGVVALVVGIIFLIIWFGYFLKGLMAIVPILLIMGGALAAYLGYEEYKDRTSPDNTDDEASDLKNEVESLREEIKVLKGDKEDSDDEGEKTE